MSDDGWPPCAQCGTRSEGKRYWFGAKHNGPVRCRECAQDGDYRCDWPTSVDSLYPERVVAMLCMAFVYVRQRMAA